MQTKTLRKIVNHEHFDKLPAKLKANYKRELRTRRKAARANRKGK